MTMRRYNFFFVLISALAVSLGTQAQAPKGYYKSIDGQFGAELKSSLGRAIAEHKVFSYSDLWDTYEVTDVVPGTKDQILEYYSDKVMYYTSRGTQINREHTVPQSWWGKGNICDAYTDLFNVLPAEAAVNGQKSNYPLGEVTGTPKFDNGVTKIGPSNNSGGANNVFEPADEYKGDFARVYFYVATCYAAAPWTAEAYSMMSAAPTIKEWTLPTLLAWNESDPVDEREMKRNEACYYLQGNRNPFVDYPQLAQFIWGDKQNELFELSDEPINNPSQTYTFVFKAGRPSFSVQYGTTPETAQPVMKGTEVTVASGNAIATIHWRVNDGKWYELAADTANNFYSPSHKVVVNGDTKIEAFTEKEDRANSDTLVAYYCVADNSDYLLYDDFATASSGNNTSTSGASSSLWTNVNFVDNENAYSAGGAVKLGTGSKAGHITSRELDFEGGRLKVELDVKGWSKIEGKIAVTLSDGQSQQLAYTATISDDFETLVAGFENVPSRPTVTIATTQKRAFVDNVKVTAVSAVPDDISTPYYIYKGGEVWYSVTGCRMSGRPDKAGIYIVNGKKVVVEWLQFHSQ